MEVALDSQQTSLRFRTALHDALHVRLGKFCNAPLKACVAAVFLTLACVSGLVPESAAFYPIDSSDAKDR